MSKLIKVSGQFKLFEDVLVLAKVTRVTEERDGKLYKEYVADILEEPVVGKVTGQRTKYNGYSFQEGNTYSWKQGDKVNLYEVTFNMRQKPILAFKEDLQLMEQDENNS